MLVLTRLHAKTYGMNILILLQHIINHGFWLETLTTLGMAGKEVVIVLKLPEELHGSMTELMNLILLKLNSQVLLIHGPMEIPFIHEKVRG